MLHQAVHDVKSEEIGPGIYRFKAEMGELALPAALPRAHLSRSERCQVRVVPPTAAPRTENGSMPVIIAGSRWSCLPSVLPRCIDSLAWLLLQNFMVSAS